MQTKDFLAWVDKTKDYAEIQAVAEKGARVVDNTSFALAANRLLLSIKNFEKELSSLGKIIG